MTHTFTNATNSETSCVTFNDSIPSSNQLAFFSFPFDIVPEIFSYLSQQDCLNCMAVCRDWYYLVPQYAQGLWMALRFGKNNIAKESQRLIRCLGDHVHSVTLDKLDKESDVYDLMCKLLEWGCTKIRLLELHRCRNGNQGAFLNALTRLAPHLTHLKMLDHESNIPFLHVLNACPELTHFTYQEIPGFATSEDTGAFDTEPVVRGTETCIGTFPKITHLYMDIMLDRRMRLDPILKRCPNLRTFVGASMTTTDLYDDLPLTDISVDFDLLFEWCPKITCIKDVLSYGSLEDLDHLMIDTNSSNEFDGLRDLSVSNVSQRSSVSQHLTASQHTVEFLSISPLDAYNDNMDWPSLLKSLQLTQLRFLILRRVSIDQASLFTICNQCPVLETMDLIFNGLTFDPSLMQQLQPMNQLRSLKLYSICFKDGLSLVDLLEQLPSLEDLFICYLTIPSKFPKVKQCSKQLKKLKLASVNWIEDDETVDLNEGPSRLFEWLAHCSNVEIMEVYSISHFGTWSLPALASISTLKELNLELEEERQCGVIQENHLGQFAMTLGESAIEKLYIETWWHLPDKTVSILKGIPLLKQLQAYHRWEDSCCNHCSNKHNAMSV